MDKRLFSIYSLQRMSHRDVWPWFSFICTLCFPNRRMATIYLNHILNFMCYCIIYIHWSWNNKGMFWKLRCPSFQLAAEHRLHLWSFVKNLKTPHLHVMWCELCISGNLCTFIHISVSEQKSFSHLYIKEPLWKWKQLNLLNWKICKWLLFMARSCHGNHCMAFKDTSSQHSLPCHPYASLSSVVQRKNRQIKNFMKQKIW